MSLDGTRREPGGTVLIPHVHHDPRVERKRVFVRGELARHELGSIVPVDESNLAGQTDLEFPRWFRVERTCATSVGILLRIDLEDSDEVTRTVRIVRLVETSDER